MKRYLFKDRIKRNQIFVIFFLLISALLFGRVMILSFSSKLDQAKANTTTAIFSGIYSSIIENGSSTIYYQANKNKSEYPFPLNMASRICQIHQNVSANTFDLHYNTVNKQDVINEQRIIKEQEIVNEQEIINEPKNKLAIGNISFDNNTNGILTKEYILTNGAYLNREDFQNYIEANATLENKSQELPVMIMEGAIDYNEFDIGFEEEGEAVETMRSYNGTPFTLEQLNDVSFLVRNFYIVDSATRVTDELFDAKTLLAKDMTIQTASDKPQILIYHTHSQEKYLDSREGVLEDYVVGVGDLLTEILEDEYGYNVIHDRGVYDIVDGKLDRNKAYNYAREGVIKIIDENPSIDVVIDLHRDGVAKRSTIIDGQEIAQIMLLNGLSRNQNGPITRLDNPNLQDNLAFSLQLQLKSLELYPGLFYKNYLQNYRYNLDIRPKSLLIELGTYKNTLRSAKKAMGPFAEILDAVLKGQ